MKLLKTKPEKVALPLKAAHPASRSQL